MKIYLSPSEQEANLYSAGNTTEEIQCNRIAEAARIALLRCGFEVKKAPQAQSMEKNVSESNAWGADLHICIHTNAGGGSGCIVFVSALDAEHKKYAQPVYNAVSAITRANEKYGVRAANFYEIRKSKGLCVYVECEFHDNATDAQWIIDNVVNIGEAICKGLCEACGVTYKAGSTESKILYRVQVGAYSTKANADKIAEKLKAAGFNAIVVKA